MLERIFHWKITFKSQSRVFLKVSSQKWLLFFLGTQFPCGRRKKNKVTVTLVCGKFCSGLTVEDSNLRFTTLQERTWQERYCIKCRYFKMTYTDSFKMTLDWLLKSLCHPVVALWYEWQCSYFRMTFPQKSPIISGFLAGKELQCKASHGSLPPWRGVIMWMTMQPFQHDFPAKCPIISGSSAERDLQFRNPMGLCHLVEAL